MPESLSERCERYRVQRNDAEAELDKLEHSVSQLRTESQRRIRHLERQVKDAEVDQRRLKNQVKAAEVSQRQLRRNNQTLKHDATQWRRFVNQWEEENERFYARVSAVSAEPGETALGARVAQRMVDALKNRVALLEKAQDQTAHEYEEVKEVAQGLKQMCHQERANSAMLVHSLQERLAQERDAREFAVQDLRRRLAQERTAKEFALQLAEDSTAREQQSAATMYAARRICAVAALGAGSTAAACIAAQEHVRRTRRKRGTKGGRRHNRGKFRA